MNTTPTPSNGLPTDPPVRTARAHRFAALAGLAVALFACAVLAGWCFDLDLLKRAHAGMVLVNPATAACFLLLGLALCLAARGDARVATCSAARLLAAAAAALALAKLAAAGAGFDAVFDRLLFAARLDGNRMAPTTAANVALIGLGLSALDRRVRGGVRPSAFLFGAAGTATRPGCGRS